MRQLPAGAHIALVDGFQRRALNGIAAIHDQRVGRFAADGFYAYMALAAGRYFSSAGRICAVLM
jgi:hypothetical protein